ncbi:MAG: S8 family peptidase [Bacteroidia bacterium]|nr:S8 family peptidase [Bacteroidia bacterium]
MSKTFVTLLFIVSAMYSRAENYIAPRPVETSSIIVQFDDEKGLDRLEALHYAWFAKAETLYLPYHIYKIEISGHVETAIHDLLGLSFVISAQPNRTLERRAITPNDSLYSEQWNMRIIQMDSAWSISQGGKNTRGEDIVIAIVDAGFDTTHPDFGNNLWVNKDEIPGSPIDNDSNGYAGDYHGWNTYANNGTIIDSIEYAVHGMSVTGIIAAVGNNHIGIAGIGWNNKFLPIIGGGNEADAIKAYGYILTQKKRYLTTAGQHGANIVSVNSSWGQSGMFANDAPIWCSLYDSMGKYGILNASAVSNTIKDLDLAGDLPTLCPSNFLITVTSTDGADGVHGGYGKSNVDIGAPGNGIRTTGSFIEQRYKYSNGTSIASPHVAAVIGLLYSAACDSFAQYAQQYPDSAALWIKYFIMHGVDTSAQLKDISVSGGRLNTYKSLLLLNDWCNGNLNISLSADPPNQPNGKSASKHFVLYPNPGNSSLTINGKIDLIERIEIIDYTGKIVQSQHGEMNVNSNEVTIQTTFAQGLYIIRIWDKDGKMAWKELWSKI